MPWRTFYQCNPWVAGPLMWPLLTWQPWNCPITPHIKTVAKIISKTFWRVLWDEKEDYHQHYLIQLVLAIICPCPSQGLFSTPPSAKFSFLSFLLFPNSSSTSSQNPLFWSQEFSSCLSTIAPLAKLRSHLVPRSTIRSLLHRRCPFIFPHKKHWETIWLGPSTAILKTIFF